MLTLRESGHPVFRAASALDKRFLKRKVESYRFTTTATRRMHSCCFAQSFLSTSSVSTEQLRIGVEDWLSKSLIMQFPAQGNPVARTNEQKDCELSPEVVSVTTKPPEIDVPAQGNLLRSHSE